VIAYGRVGRKLRGKKRAGVLSRNHPRLYQFVPFISYFVKSVLQRVHKTTSNF
jgi:hypothetical protein